MFSRSHTSMKALVTGSGGLIGSECVRVLTSQGWDVLGIDNDTRRDLFGAAGTTQPVIAALEEFASSYRHAALDIRDRQAIRDLFESERPDFIIHTAGQPSHDKAASIPYDDFDINAVGTLNLLVAARDFCRESPFCFTSTNKVYGDRPNYLALTEQEKRYEYADGRDGIDENMSIDNCLHSLLGASKAAADILCQEFGRYFDMPIGIYRAGCLTGPMHAAVELHGYLAYIVHCAVTGKHYTVYGYKGKQVRDQLHARDVANAFLEFQRDPAPGEVFNLGGGRANSLSILETVDLLADMGLKLDYSYDDQNRTGDHICYISDLTKIQTRYPNWRLEYDTAKILDEIVSQQRKSTHNVQLPHRCRFFGPTVSHQGGDS